MLKSLHFLFVLLVGTVVILAASSCTSSSSIDPNYKFREGDVTKYKYQTTQKGKVIIDGDTQDFDLKMENTISHKTKSVDEQGIATIDAGYEDVKLTVDGEDLPLPDMADALITYQVDKDGVIKSVKGTNGLAGPLGERQFDPAQIFQFQGPMFQEGTLNKGDKWQQTVAVTLPGTEGTQAIIDYSYEGNQRVDGKNAAKFHFSFQAPLNIVYNDMDQVVKVAGQELMEGSAYFSLSDGKTIKADGKGPLSLSLSMPTEGGGQDQERVKVAVDVGFDYKLQQ